jgi:hypothetical protein
MGRPLFELHTKPEAYRSGWVSGFYETHAPVAADDEDRLDKILRHGTRDESDRQFLEGHREGYDERYRRLACS